MNKHRLLSTPLSCIATGLILTFSVVLLQRYHDSCFAVDRPAFEDLKYLPSGKFLKGAMLSFDEIVADLLLIKSLSYFGSHYKTDKDFRWLYRILDVTTTLDPYFEDPYEFGGIILGQELGEPDLSLTLLEKGMKHVPRHHKRYWYLPFHIAFIHMYHKGDYKTAAHYLEIAASFPQRPAYLPLLVARLYANTEDPGIAIPFLNEMLDRAGSLEMKEKLRRRIRELQVKQHILLLTNARNRYRQITGNDIDSLEALVTGKILKSIPREPFGGHYYFSIEDDTIRSTTKVDSLKLHLQTNTTEPLIFQNKR